VSGEGPSHAGGRGIEATAVLAMIDGGEEGDGGEVHHLVGGDRGEVHHRVGGDGGEVHHVEEGEKEKYCLCHIGMTITHSMG